MSPDKWQEISRIFNAVIEKEPSLREKFLADICGGDEDLRNEIGTLLSAHESGDSFIDSPGAGLKPEPFELGLKKGDKIDAFEIEKLLGKGGMGEVYLARDTRLNRPVAIKILPPAIASDSQANRRLLREAQAAALEHPNICTIHEIVETEECNFIVMQYVEGEPLSEILKNGALGLRRTLKIGLQVVEAIADAHRNGVIHRDIKPANIVVSPNDQVKVLDFGLAKRISPKDDDSPSLKSILSQPGLILGTASYMSPEQARGLSVDGRTDLWSFGVVFYEMTVGKRPFEGNSLADKFVSILHDEPPLPGGLSDELKRIITRLLEKDADRRYQTAQELLIDLRTLRQEVEFEKQLQTHISVDSGSPTINAKILGSDDRGSEKTLFIVEKKPKTFWQKIGLMQIALGGLILFLLGIGGWYLRHQSDINWARENVKKIAELASNESNFEAYDLALQVQGYIPEDEELKKLMPTISDKISVQSEPGEARVFLKRFLPNETGDFPESVLIGTTPIKDFQIARGHYILRIEKDGFAPFERTISGTIPRIGGSFIDSPPLEIDVKLIGTERSPENMVFVPGGEYSLVNWSRPIQDKVRLDDFFIDKYEVSNREFKEFINSGGYLKKEFWKHAFIKAGQEISLEEAVRNFKDKTGLPAPRSWSNQNFPEGEEDLPVTGITWYEAAAYAAYRGKQLPTVFQWERAARNGVSDPRYNAMPWGLIKQGETTDFRANFGSTGSVSVKKFEFGMSPFGAFNMAGNVSEWVLNRSGDNYVTSGGAWNDLPYSFGDYGEYPGFYASDKLGFRCVLNLSETGSDQGAQDVLPDEIPNYAVSGENDHKMWLTHYQYDQKPLNPQIVETREAQDWIRRTITFTGENDETVSAYLYLPKNYARPLQVIHYLPPGDVVDGLRPLPDSVEMFMTPLIKSGRAVFTVSLRGYSERPFPDNYVPPARNTVEFRKQAVNWMTDLRRGLDYLETVDEVDFKKLSFLGISNGANLGILVLGIEKRYKAAVLVGSGVDKSWQEWIPEANFINFAPHSKLPKLFINGRYDEAHPLETYSEPIYKIFSEPKKQVIYDGGHIPTIEFFSTTINDWLDEKIGPPARF